MARSGKQYARGGRLTLIRERTIEGLRRAKMQGKQAGRPRGSKDKKKRRKAGYILREAKKRQRLEVEVGLNRSIDTYLDR